MSHNNEIKQKSQFVKYHSKNILPLRNSILEYNQMLNLGSSKSPKIFNELHQLISWWDIVNIYIKEFTFYFLVLKI